MTPEERSLINGLFERLREVQSAPRDAEAEALIRQRVAEMPNAPYALAQSVLVQEHALQQANAYIQEMEAYATELETRLAAAPAPAPQSGGFLGGLLGGRSSVPAAGTRTVPPVAQGRSSDPWGNARTEARTDAPMGVPPGYGGGQSAPYGGAPQQDPYAQNSYGQPYGQASGPVSGPYGQGQPQAQPARGGGGFLQGALATAAGVAGGALLFDGIKNLMGGGSSPIAQHAAAELPKIPTVPDPSSLGSSNLSAEAQHALGGAPNADHAPIDQTFWDDNPDEGGFDDSSDDFGSDDDGSWA